MQHLTTIRRLLFAAALVVLAACGDCGTACKEGITFYVAEVSGALARGTTEPLKICFDGKCSTTIITRSNPGGTVFLPFKGVGSKGDHTLTVTGTGSMSGSYTGPIESYAQKTGCGTCSLASVKIGADGTVTPGHVVPPTTTSPTTSPTTNPTTATTTAATGG
jgi:hypothetical protein